MNTPQQEDMEDRCARPSGMVERVALAIHAVLVENRCDQAVCKFVNGCGCASDAAKAAIEAMKYLDGFDEMDAIQIGTKYRVDPVSVIEIWDAIIDAALSPAQRSSNPQQEKNER